MSVGRMMRSYDERKARSRGDRPEARVDHRRLRPVWSRRLPQPVTIHRATRKAFCSLKPYQANRTLGVLSKMFNLAEIWGLRPDGSNPCLHVKKYPEQRRERFLSLEEFAALGKALREIEVDGSETQSAVDAIRLLMLTGCRLGEIMKLKWDYVDLNTRELRLPDSKTGAKIVHFGNMACDVLKDIEKLEDNPYVITGKKQGSRLTDLQHPWRRIRAKAGLDGVRIHDLRHSYASGALALGEGLPMIGKLLGHTQVQTTARYAHLANDPVKSAAGRVSDTIGAAMLGRKSSAKRRARSRIGAAGERSKRAAPEAEQRIPAE